MIPLAAQGSAGERPEGARGRSTPIFARPRGNIFYMRASEGSAREPEADGPPPFLRTWGRVYAALLVYLAALVALFWLFQRRFTP
jgi:hypothetical protein